MIADTNVDYAERLARALVFDYGHLLNVEIYAEVTAIAKLSLHKGDLLLINASLYQNQLVSNGFPLTILLCDQCNMVLSQELKGQIRCVYKYQHVSKIIQQVFLFYSEVEPNYNVQLSLAAHQQVIAVYSPAGGSGNSTVAVAMAQQYTNLGYRVLYLSLE